MVELESMMQSLNIENDAIDAMKMSEKAESPVPKQIQIESKPRKAEADQSKAKLANLFPETQRQEYQ